MFPLPPPGVLQIRSERLPGHSVLRGDVFLHPARGRLWVSGERDTNSFRRGLSTTLPSVIALHGISSPFLLLVAAVSQEIDGVETGWALGAILFEANLLPFQLHLPEGEPPVLPFLPFFQFRVSLVGTFGFGPFPRAILSFILSFPSSSVSPEPTTFQSAAESSSCGPFSNSVDGVIVAFLVLALAAAVIYIMFQRRRFKLHQSVDTGPLIYDYSQV